MAPHKPRIRIGQLRRFKAHASRLNVNGQFVEGTAFVVTALRGESKDMCPTVDILLQGELVTGWHRQYIVRNSEVIG